MLRHQEKSATRCPLCREELEAEALALVSCADCETTTHELCFLELGGCATLGCSRKGVRPGTGSGISLEQREAIRRRVAENNARWARLVVIPKEVAVQESADALTLSLARDRKSGLLGVATAVAGFGFAIAGLLRARRPSDLLILFGVLALVALSALLYWGLVELLNSYVIRVTDEALTVRTGPLPWPGRHTINTCDVRDIRIERKPLGEAFERSWAQRSLAPTPRIFGGEETRTLVGSAVFVVLADGTKARIVPWSVASVPYVFLRDRLRRRLGLDGSAKGEK